MAISDSLDAGKRAIEEVKRNNTFRKANKEREVAVQLQVALVKCRGKLEICSRDFDRAIHTQAANIRAGQREGMDTLIQEQILWDAAIGYMLVRDAIFSLKTINSYDSVEHAYDMLEQAVDQMTNKSGKARKPKLGSKIRRDEYGFISSSSARQEKERILDLFFDKLKMTGDIEQCLIEARSPDAEWESNSPVASSLSSLDETMQRLRGEAGKPNEEDIGQIPSSFYDLNAPTGRE